MGIGTVELSTGKKLRLVKVWIPFSIGVAGLIGYTIALDQAIKKYQPVTNLASALSGKSVEQVKQDSIEYRVQNFFKRYDPNNDGVVDLAEYRAVVTRDNLEKRF